MEALIPRGGFNEKVAGNPDLYGPLWISTTVIFALFMASTIAGSINSYLAGVQYEVNVTLLSFASISVYTYAVVMPGVVWGLGKYFASPIAFLDAVGVYGYGLSIWVPVSILCILPMELLRWLIILFAFLLSTYFLMQNLLPGFGSSPKGPSARTAALIAIVAGNAVLALTFRFGFFRYVSTVGGGGGGKDTTPPPKDEKGFL
ncbi:hypothetical protein HDU97_002122 [Phlyctochytrium planicorne]|nr:hypothetical protein HDU97_002122 [Phlyctochytrium planicorne]